MAGKVSRSAAATPAWQQRSVDRAVANATRRAEQRVQRFMSAARAVMTDNGTTDFTVQEVVDRSGQSLRCFYVHFAGKRERLLALYEEELLDVVSQIRSAAAGEPDSLERIRAAMAVLRRFYLRGEPANRVLLAEFAPGLLLSHPDYVRRAYAPLTMAFIELFEDAHTAGRLSTAISPKRLAVLTLQTVMTTAHGGGGLESVGGAPTADEVWRWCSVGFAMPRCR